MKRRTLIRLFVLIWFIYIPYIGNASITSHALSVATNNDLHELLQTAEEHRDNEEYGKAIDIYNKALALATEKNLNNDVSFIYRNIGKLYKKQENHEKAKEYYLKSIRSHLISQNAADSHLELAFLYRRNKQSDSLMFHLSKSLQIYSILEDSEDKYITYYKAGVLLRNNGNYDTAIKYLLEAYEGLNTGKNNLYMARICSAIALTQRLMKNYDIAQKYYYEALRLRVILNDPLRISYAYNNLGNLYRHQRILDSARFYYEKAIVTQRELKKTKKLGLYYNNLATVYYLENNFIEAEKNYRKSIDIKKKDRDTLFLVSPYTELATVNIERNKNTIAKKYLDSASYYLNIHKTKDILQRYYQVQSQYYESIGSLGKALEYHKKYYLLSEQLAEENLIQTSQKLQEQFESKQRLQKIKELTEGNKEQKNVINKQQESIDVRNTLLIISGFIILLAVFMYFLIRQRQKTREKGFELQRLEDIFKEQEIVKSKISKDLHDIVITSYNSIRLKILALPKADNPSAVSKVIISEINGVNDEIRLISHRLSPLGDKIETSTLTEIIIDQLTEFQHYRKIFVDIQLPLPKELNSFNLASQTNLYGIILEVLNNIEKHAQATEINVTHHKKNDLLSLSISDNGIGFKNENNNGIGLINIKQRAQLLKGKSIILSTDVGTTITITFPIKINIT